MPEYFIIESATEQTFLESLNRAVGRGLQVVSFSTCFRSVGDTGHVVYFALMSLQTAAD